MNLIVCQSPKYLESSLSLLDEQSSSVLLIREVSGVYRFLIKNEFVEKKRLLFIPVYKRNNLFNVIRNIYVIRKFCTLYSNKFNNVYLFTNDNDFTTMSILSMLSISGEIYFYSYNNLLYDDKFLVRFLNRFIYKIRSFQCENGQAYGFLSNNVKIHVGFSIQDYQSSKYQLSLGVSTKNVLLIDSNDENNLNLNNIEEIYSKVLEHCKKNNFSVYIKGHPRLGLSKILQGRENVNYLDSNIPFELLDITKFDRVLGIYSTGLCSSQSIHCSYSLLPLCKSRKEKYYKKYLKSNGLPLGSFIYSFDELYEMLES